MEELYAQLLSGPPAGLARYGAAFVHDLMQKNSVIPAPPPIPGEGRESVLIVPLGKFPMVATQIYTLLTKQAQRTIREVVLVYPQSQGIENAARIVREALEEEAHVRCTRVPIPGLQDIDSRDACTRYQQALEDAIDRVRIDHPGCIIDLALSGGRKGMTAMTIFAAQKKCIFEVYHTLITDEDLSKRIDDEASVAALEKPGLSPLLKACRTFNCAGLAFFTTSAQRARSWASIWNCCSSWAERKDCLGSWM
jgi:CRISPR-associated Csx14 family protein